MYTHSELSSLKDAVRTLEDQGITARADQAAALGLKLSTYQYRLRRAEIGSGRASLGHWIPWTVSRAHHSKAVARRLRLLAAAADGRVAGDKTGRGKAIQWAHNLVDRGLDVTYDPENGWGTKRARRSDWYIKRLLEAAEQQVLPLPQLDDLGERSEM